MTDTTYNNVELYLALKKSKAIAYILFFLCGSFGIHRIYLKDYPYFYVYWGIILLTIFITPLFLTLLYMLLIFDLFYTAVLCNKYNKKLKLNITGV